jgi:2-polyprenyl-3-methyl-5-hydroxy-6-metoxy-1,4-benzoquinol methylase
MQHTRITAATANSTLEPYVIQHGKEDAPRLNVLAAALAPSTTALLDRLGSMENLMVIDAACGGGDVTVELSRRVGRGGRVAGLDADAGKLEAASERARMNGADNCTFAECDITQPWPIHDADIVYARFILTHLREPERLLASAWNALKPGGLMVVEDIDTEGCFCYPASDAFAQSRELYVAAAKLRGCDPFIGRRLGHMFDACGFQSVGTALAHPYGRQGPAKDVMVMTIHAIADAVLASGLLTEPALRSLLDELDTYAAREDTIMSMPRVFQAWGVKA